jgi:hypothetical protein
LQYLRVSKRRYWGLWPFGMLNPVEDTLTYPDFSEEKDSFKNFR